MEARIDYREIVQAEIMAHSITVCLGCKNGCDHSRGYAFPDSREIHFNAKCATRGTLYGFLHEVGHIVQAHGKHSTLRRYQQEFEAEKYARDSMRMYGLTVPRKQVAMGNSYVARWKRFGDKIKASKSRG